MKPSLTRKNDDFTSGHPVLFGEKRLSHINGEIKAKLQDFLQNCCSNTSLRITDITYWAYFILYFLKSCLKIASIFDPHPHLRDLIFEIFAGETFLFTITQPFKTTLKNVEQSFGTLQKTS